jgi:hypothetical protein
MDSRRIIMKKGFNHSTIIVSTIIEEIEDMKRRKLRVRKWLLRRESWRFS